MEPLGSGQLGFPRSWLSDYKGVNGPILKYLPLTVQLARSWVLRLRGRVDYAVSTAKQTALAAITLFLLGRMSLGVVLLMILTIVGVTCSVLLVVSQVVHHVVHHVE